MKISFLGAHNTESRNTKLVSLLIDDNLALDAGGLTSSLSFSEQMKLRAVLVTHQHYDHIKDIPLLGMNLFLNNASIDIYSIPSVYESLASHLLNDDLYPDFLEETEGGATIRFHTIKTHHEFKIGDYDILPLPVAHSVPRLLIRCQPSVIRLLQVKASRSSTPVIPDRGWLIAGGIFLPG